MRPDNGVIWEEIEDRVRRVALAISRRYWVAGMDREDVEEELVIHAWKVHGRWREGGGKTIINFLGHCMTNTAFRLMGEANTAKRTYDGTVVSLDSIDLEPGFDEDVVSRMDAIDRLERVHERLKQIVQDGEPTPASRVMAWLMEHPDRLGAGGRDTMGRSNRGGSWYEECQRDIGVTRNQIIHAMSVIRRTAARMGGADDGTGD